MTYECTTNHPRLTVGLTYQEWAVNPNPYNACVKNDLGEYEYFPKHSFFKVIKPA